MKMKDEICDGHTTTSLDERDRGLFPNMVVQMVAIGEESGAIDTMLGKVADWYEQEVDDAVEGLTSLLGTRNYGLSRVLSSAASSSACTSRSLKWVPRFNHETYSIRATNAVSAHPLITIVGLNHTKQRGSSCHHIIEFFLTNPPSIPTYLLSLSL